MNILAQESKKESMLGALLYKSVLNAEKTRQEMFECEKIPRARYRITWQAAHAPVAGKLNGKEFSMISDTDLRIGEKLEIFAAGDYMWLSYADIATIQIAPPNVSAICFGFPPR